MRASIGPVPPQPQLLHGLLLHGGVRGGGLARLGDGVQRMASRKDLVCYLKFCGRGSCVLRVKYVNVIWGAENKESSGYEDI